MNYSTNRGDYGLNKKDFVNNVMDMLVILTSSYMGGTVGEVILYFHCMFLLTHMRVDPTLVGSTIM